MRVTFAFYTLEGTAVEIVEQLRTLGEDWHGHKKIGEFMAWSMMNAAKLHGKPLKLPTAPELPEQCFEYLTEMQRAGMLKIEAEKNVGEEEAKPAL